MSATRFLPVYVSFAFVAEVSTASATPIPTSWEDTVNVVAKGRVTIAFRPGDRPGQWMYHCHILEHYAAGMMGRSEVAR
jgi:FtsP/CotA-like multicopper oxidase with cupredoxin domain